MMRWKNILKATSILYSLSLVIWFLIRPLTHDHFWLLAIINTTILFFFLPLPILFLSAFFQRQKKLIATLSIPALIFLLLWGSQFLPKTKSPSNNSTHIIQTMSFNVLFSNKTPRALLDSINAASPDLIGFQELTAKKRDLLKTDLAEKYPFHTFDSDIRGVGLLSRYPILSVTELSFPPKNHAIHVILDWEGQPLHVFVAHLSANHFFSGSLNEFPERATQRYNQRATQVSRLLEEIESVDAPIILMCDCNLTDTSEAYFRLSQELNDSFHDSGWGLGLTNRAKGISIRTQRIDYIWYNDYFVSINSHVGKNGGSDHHPVISTLGYNGHQ